MTTRRALRGPQRRRGFTLVELLVVIGIIVLLASIATPMIITARRNAEQVRTRSDLNTIALALEAYKADHKSYPMPNPNQPNVPVLAWALVGPWPAVGEGANNPGDGADGFGFRTQWDNTNKVGSKVFGPYLPPDKFAVDDKARPFYILDRFDQKIEYLPLWRPAKPGRKLFGVPGSGDPLVAGIGTVLDSTNIIYDCRQASDPRAIYYLQRALGDGAVDPHTHNDLIDPPGEQMQTTPPPFLLLSVSYRKAFSPKEEVDKNFGKTTEVTNLQQP